MSEPIPDKRKRNQAIARSTGLLIIMFGAAKAISLVQTVIIARFFGVGSEWAAYVTANRIPETIVILIAGGALGNAFIPVLSGLLAKGRDEEADRLFSHVVNIIFLISLIASAVAFTFAPWLVRNVLAPGFEDPVTIQQTINMMRLLLLGTLIFSISGIAMSVLHSYNRFLLPALAPILYDVGILIGVLFLIEPFGIYGVAYGTILGASMHLLIQVPGLIRNGVRWVPEFGWRDPLVAMVAILMLPRVVGFGLDQFVAIMMNNLGSRLGVEAVAAIDWGWRLMQIPQTLIGTAMSTVIFPTLAKLSEVQDEEGRRQAFAGAMSFVLIASIPAATGLVLVGYPLLTLLEGGAFDASATSLVYGTLRGFALGIVVHSVLEISARSFYADKDTLTPLLISVVGVSVNFGLALWLSGVLLGGPLLLENASGIALANSLGITVEVTILLFVLHRRWNGIAAGPLALTTGKTILASAIMGLGVIGVAQAFEVLGLQGRFVYTIVQVGVQIITGGVIFLIAALFLRITALGQLLAIFFGRDNVELESVSRA